MFQIKEIKELIKGLDLLSVGLLEHSLSNNSKSAFQFRTGGDRRIAVIAIGIEDGYQSSNLKHDCLYYT